ncbi:TetR/AcrR family transcriptional regulator [Halanaerobaculum tunisiense]
MHPKKERIFTVAVERFSQKGSTSTTMNEIAKEAGVGKGTLYRYFDDKEGLISSLIETGFEELIEQVQQAVVDLTDPVEKLEEVIAIQLEFYNQNRSFSKFLTREIWGYKDKFEENIKKIRSNYTVIVEEIIQQGINNGDFKEVNAETAATSLIGMVNITTLHWFMFKESFPVQEIKDDIINLYFEGVIES